MAFAQRLVEKRLVEKQLVIRHSCKLLKSNSSEITTLFDEILQRMRDKVSSHQYLMTLHAEEEISDDNLTIYNIEQGILTGEILER